MIEKMKRLSLVVHHSSREAVLDGLQKIGVYHVEQKTPVESEQITQLRDTIVSLSHYHKTLKQYQQDYQVNLPQDKLKGDISELMAEIDSIRADMASMTTQVDQLRKEAAILSHYGEFDPAVVEALEKARVKVAFCSCAKTKFAKLDTSTLALEILGESRGFIFYVVFVNKNEKLSDKEQEVLANQEEIPLKRLSEVRAEIEGIESAWDARVKLLIDHTKYLDAVQNEILAANDRLAHALATSGMSAEAEGAVYILSGFVPSEKLAETEAYLQASDAVYLVEEPTHHDKGPVKLKQNPFARLFEPILRLYSIPNYWEVDSTPFFAPFYAVFFGMCVADVGYGLILFIGAAIAFFAIKSKSARKFITLALILGASVILSGLLFDDFFGVRPVTDYEKEVAIATAAHTEMPTAPAPILMNMAIFRHQNDAMFFPLLLGAFQMVFGWGVRIRNNIKHHGWQGFGEPFGNILFMFGVFFMVMPMLIQSIFKADPGAFHVGPMPVGQWMSSMPANITTAVFGLGILLILLFNHLDTKIFLRPLAGLYSIFELLQSLIGDILSYIRLFALGMAGGLLAEAFNGLGHMVVSGPGVSPVMYIFAALILLAGHGLNFAIGLMSAFVHSLRLQFVEFYKAIEFKGGGVEYEPLRLRDPIQSLQSVKKHVKI